MPQSFYCKACHLGFAVGWFHYHDCADGYWAETMLICSACGTMHTVVHPGKIEKPVLGGLFRKHVEPELPDLLKAQDGPVQVNSPEDPVMQRLKEWRQREVSHVLCPKSKHDYMQGF